MQEEVKCFYVPLASLTYAAYKSQHRANGAGTDAILPNDIAAILAQDSASAYSGIMKTTIDIPDLELADAMKYTRARTKREAIVTALTEFNQRRRMAALVRHAGTCDALIAVEDLKRLRRKR